MTICFSKKSLIAAQLPPFLYELFVMAFRHNGRVEWLQHKTKEPAKPKILTISDTL